MRRAPLLLLSTSLIVAGLCAYWTSFDGVLVMDDINAISANPSIGSFSTAFSPPMHTTVSGRPVANVTFAIDYAISGLNLWSYHATNLAIHVAAAILLFGLLRRTFQEPKVKHVLGGETAWVAWAIALIWVVHPLQTSAVTYVVQRVESLMSLWLLLTIYCAVRAGDHNASRWWTPAALLCCALGMATKEVMVVTPVLVWLWYRTFRPKSPLPRVVLLLPLTWLVLIPLVTGAPRGQTAGFGAGGWTAWTYLVTQAGVVAHYLRLVFYPVPLIFHYAWKQPESIIEVAPQALLLIVLLAATVTSLVRRRPIGFAGAWFFGVLAPSSSIVPIATEVAAEHRMYLASAAVVAVVVTSLFAACRTLLHERTAVVTTVVAAALAAAALGVETSNRNRDYWSDERLWGDTVKKEPASPRAQLGYALAMVNAKRWTEAEPHAQAAVRLEPWNPLAHRTLGFSYAGEGRLLEAEAELERALALYPVDGVAQKALMQIRAARTGS